MLRRFDEGINAKREFITNHPEYKFKSDLYMAYHDEHIEEYRLMREAIMDEATDAAQESTKIPRLQKALQEFDENFDVIGLINFNWDHTVIRSPSHHLSGRKIPEPKSTIIKNKYAVRYLAGQEKMCRLSGMAQKITPELLQLRQRDQDMHKVLKVALQPPPPAGKKTLVDFGVYRYVRESYFRADYFCKDKHEDVVHRHKLRKTAVDSADQAGGGSIVPVVSMDKFFYEMKRPRTIADLNYGLVTGSSSSLTSSALGTLPSSSSEGVVLRSRFRLWVVKRATQRLWTVTTPTSSCPLVSTVSESILLSRLCFSLANSRSCSIWIEAASQLQPLMTPYAQRPHFYRPR